MDKNLLDQRILDAQGAAENFVGWARNAREHLTRLPDSVHSDLAHAQVHLDEAVRLFNDVKHLWKGAE